MAPSLTLVDPISGKSAAYCRTIVRPWDDCQEQVKDISSSEAQRWLDAKCAQGFIINNSNDYRISLIHQRLNSKASLSGIDAILFANAIWRIAPSASAA